MLTSRRTRLLAAGLIAASAALIAVRVWLLQGLTSVVRIHGGSMAEALPGEHVQATCPRCARTWRCDAQQAAAKPQLTCPECLQRTDTPERVESATRVILDRGAYLLESPRRFDVVAVGLITMNPPIEPTAAVVKRIVALPGETWEIRGGEIYIEGKLLRKSYRQFRETAVLVSQHHAKSAFSWEDESRDGLDWRTFHSVAMHPAAGGKPSPVQDYDAYNPTVARELNEVIDLLAECVIAGDSPFQLRVHDGYEHLSIEYDAGTREVVARRKGREVARNKLAQVSKPQRKIAWGLLDRQLLLVVDGNVVLQHELEEATAPPHPIPAPLAIGLLQGGGLETQWLRVLRDIYYLDDQGRGGSWKRSEEASPGYGLLGDNPPLSKDSREWEDAVRRGEILGRVFVR